MKTARDSATVIQFGQRLRALRQQCKLTQQAVADHLQIHRTTYNKYEAGNVTPDQQGLVRLAEVFGVTVDHLLGCNDDPTAHLADAEKKEMALTLQEKTLVQMFRQLDSHQQEELVARICGGFRDQSE